MKKYYIEVVEHCSHVVTIDADSVSDAIAEARDYHSEFGYYMSPCTEAEFSEVTYEGTRIGTSKDINRISYKEIEELISYAFSSKNREEMWSFLYDTEYLDEHDVLNEAMAKMTDTELNEWFPKILTEYLMKKLNLL